MSKGSFTVLAIDEALGFKITQGEADCDSTDLKPVAKLVFTGNQVGEFPWVLKDF